MHLKTLLALVACSLLVACAQPQAQRSTVQNTTQSATNQATGMDGPQDAVIRYEKAIASREPVVPQIYYSPYAVDQLAQLGDSRIAQQQTDNNILCDRDEWSEGSEFQDALPPVVTNVTYEESDHATVQYNLPVPIESGSWGVCGTPTGPTTINYWYNYSFLHHTVHMNGSWYIDKEQDLIDFGVIPAVGAKADPVWKKTVVNDCGNLLGNDPSAVKACFAAALSNCSEAEMEVGMTYGRTQNTENNFWIDSDCTISWQGGLVGIHVGVANCGKVNAATLFNGTSISTQFKALCAEPIEYRNYNPGYGFGETGLQWT